MTGTAPVALFAMAALITLAQTPRYATLGLIFVLIDAAVMVGHALLGACRLRRRGAPQ